MATLKTTDMRVQDASNLIRDISERPYYFFVGKPTPWSDSQNPSISDSNPPRPIENSYSYYNSALSQIMSLKKISEVDVSHLISRNTWITGTVYDMYRHDYSSRNASASGSTSLEGSIFCVVNNQSSVYVCLYNGTSPINPRGIPSTVEPLSRNQEAFYTSDGYQWLYLYTMTNADVSNYSTNNFIPVRDYSYSPEYGKINTIVIDNSGSGYTSSPSGVADTLQYYYCNIVGDGSGAVARVSIESGRVSTIEVIRGGSDYTYANLVFEANKVYKSIQDLDNRNNALDPLGNFDFRSTVIISPPGGWGNDLPRQLISTKVGIFTNLQFDTSDFINQVEFRQIGILNSILYSDPSFETNETLSGHDALCVISTTDYNLLEEINQEVTNSFGDVVIARGTVIAWDPSTGILRYIQDPKIHSDSDGNLHKFDPNGGAVVGLDSATSGNVDVFFNSNVAGRIFSGGFSISEYLKYTGRLVYASNIQPVLRDSQQIERVSIVISY